MAKKDILGESRKHKKPGNDAAKNLENEMAKRQYSDKLQLAKAMVKKGFVTDLNKIMTRVRKRGGVAVRTPLGITSRPHVIEIGHELSRRKNVSISYLLNALGVLEYHKAYISRLRRGGAPVQNDLVNRLHEWCQKVLAYALKLETKLGIRRLRK